MVLLMSVNRRMDQGKAQEKLLMLMEVSMMANGQMIKKMVMGNINI